VDLHGSPGREAATGRGCLVALCEALQADDKRLDNQRIAVQGFGNVGSWFCKLAAERGASIVAISDAGGAVRQAGGLDIGKLIEHVQERGTVDGFSGGEAMPPGELLAVDCDVLVPAAVGHVLTAETAPNVRAAYVLEAANGPCTLEGDRILRERGIQCLPDIWVNAGGVTASYFEWIQNNQHMRWKEDDVNERLCEFMVRAHGAIRQSMRAHDCDMRTAALVVAVQRVNAATDRRGFG
jgi:glutamate dehydrogenase (NAD(P)+)